MKWYFKVWKKAFIFGGRARRKEFWMFCLFNYLVAMGFVYFDEYLSAQIMFETIDFGRLAPKYLFLSCIPWTSVAVRRMHDVEESGSQLFIPIYNIILTTNEGTRGPNKYGSDPKA